MKGSLLRTNEELTRIYIDTKTVYRVCFMYMKTRLDTEDMVQNTFLRLMRDKTIFQSEEHEKAWLIRTATNLCKDHFKHWWSKTVRTRGRHCCGSEIYNRQQFRKGFASSSKIQNPDVFILP